MKIAVVGAGAIGCLSGLPNLFTVAANEDTIVMRIPKEEIHSFISVNPLNAERMLRDLSGSTAILLKHVELVRGDTAE